MNNAATPKQQWLIRKLADNNIEKFVETLKSTPEGNEYFSKDGKYYATPYGAYAVVNSNFKKIVQFLAKSDASLVIEKLLSGTK